MLPCTPPWCPPVAVGVPLPLPAINVLGIKVGENDTSSFINVGPTFIGHSASNTTAVLISQVIGDWGYAPVWWGNVNDYGGANANAWAPQGYL